MNFLVKDLMISVLPDSFDPGKLAGSCGACTGNSEGPPCTGVCPGTRDPLPGMLEQIAIEGNPAVLAFLKLRLKEHINAIEAREAAVREAMRPRTEADIAALKTKLEG